MAKKAKAVRTTAWAVMIRRYNGGPFDMLCKWAEPTREQIMRVGGGAELNPACYKPVRVEMRLLPPRKERRRG